MSSMSIASCFEKDLYHSIKTNFQQAPKLNQEALTFEFSSSANLIAREILLSENITKKSISSSY